MKILSLMMAGALALVSFITADAGPVLHGESGVLQAFAPVREMPGDSLPEKVRAFKKEWNKKLDKLDAKIARDQKKLQKAGNRAKAKLRDKISDLKAERDDLQKEIDEAGDKTAAQWDDFKEDVSRKYKALNKKVKDFFKDED